MLKFPEGIAVRCAAAATVLAGLFMAQALAEPSKPSKGFGLGRAATSTVSRGATRRCASVPTYRRVDRQSWMGVNSGVCPAAKGGRSLARYVIEAGIGSAGNSELEAASGQLNGVLRAMQAAGRRIQWDRSHVTGKTFHLCLADLEELIHEHSDRTGFPATTITEVGAVIDPTTGPAWLPVETAARSRWAGRATRMGRNDDWARCLTCRCCRGDVQRHHRPDRDGRPISRLGAGRSRRPGRIGNQGPADHPAPGTCRRGRLRPGGHARGARSCGSVRRRRLCPVHGRR